MADSSHKSGDERIAANAGQLGWRQLYMTEDWWAVWIGGALLGLFTLLVWQTGASGSDLLKKWLSKPGGWTDNPLDAFTVKGASVWPGICGAFVLSFVAFGLGARVMGKRLSQFAAGFVVVFLLAVLSQVLAGQATIKYYNLEYAIWALGIGLLISNTVGTPRWILSASCTEFYIKTGLVVLGAEVLFGRLLALGVPGIFVAWVVTPIVLVTTFWFGQRILRISSPTLNIVISSDMSVCGVSAAIATAAACRAKRSELSLAIGLSLAFTVIMMVVMPPVIKMIGLSNIVGGAWLGGTIDSTGAVAAAAAMLGDDALQVAATVKMIQNILIGVVAFFVAVYWVTYVERTDDRERPGLMEIWHRFPKFILGFIAASIVFSVMAAISPEGEHLVDAVLGKNTATLRNWFFCLAFVSIGLETNFRELSVHLKGGRPLILYVVGQSFNLFLTLVMAWIMFEKVFPHAADMLSK